MIRASKFFLFQTNPQLLAKTATNTIAKKNFQKFQLENAVFINKKTNKKLAQSTHKKMIREAFKGLNKDEIQLFEGKVTEDWNKFVIGVVGKSKKDKPQATKVEIKKKSDKKSEPKIAKSESVKKTEPKAIKAKPQEPARIKGSKYKNPEQQKTTPIKTIPTSISGKDIFKKELVADKYFSAILNRMENSSD